MQVRIKSEEMLVRIKSEELLVRMKSQEILVRERVRICIQPYDLTQVNDLSLIHI